MKINELFRGARPSPNTIECQSCDLLESLGRPDVSPSDIVIRLDKMGELISGNLRRHLGSYSEQTEIDCLLFTGSMCAVSSDPKFDNDPRIRMKIFGLSAEISYFAPLGSQAKYACQSLAQAHMRSADGNKQTLLDNAKGVTIAALKEYLGKK